MGTASLAKLRQHHLARPLRRLGQRFDELSDIVPERVRAAYTRVDGGLAVGGQCGTQAAKAWLESLTR